jgi:archaellum component FlaG (FlaF/FlaG flagellin family)
MRQTLPGRAFRTLAATALATGLYVLLVKAQAAGEYSMGASKSVAGAVEVGNTMSRSLSKATDALSDKLKTATRESPAQVMKENRAAFAKEAGEGGGTLRFASDPSDAAVFVDGRLVARTPTEIKVPQGKHAIKITRSDRDQWVEQASVAKGQVVDISAKLVNPYPSAVTLSFDHPKK